MILSDNMRGAIYMNIGMAAFTFNDAGMKVVTQTLPLFQAITLRGLMTVALLGSLALMTGALRYRPARRDGKALALRTLGEVGGTVFFLVALVHMPLANLSAIMQSLPLAVTLAGALFLREPVGWRRMLAIVVGFCGVLLIVRPGAEGFDIWSVMGLGSVACVVVRDLVTRELSRSVPSVLVAFWASLGVTAMGLAGVAVTGWQPVTAVQLGLIAASACALIVGYLFVVMMMRVGEIGFIAPFRYTALLWAILLGWLVFDTLPDALTVAGAGIVIATGIFTLYRERHGARRAAATG